MAEPRLSFDRRMDRIEAALLKVAKALSETNDFDSEFYKEVKETLDGSAATSTEST